jgi:hypothetical protein
MVKGANIPNTRGIAHVSNAVLNLMGLISHHTNRAILGPNRNNDVIIQHIDKG